MNYTENGLRLPESSDNFNVEDMNFNTEKISTEFNSLNAIMGYNEIVGEYNSENNTIEFELKDVKLENFKNNQRLLIETPSNIEITATRNILNGIEIEPLLLPSFKYELVYENGIFTISKGIYKVTVGTEWVDGAQTIEVKGIKATDVPVVDVVLSDNNITAQAELEA